MNVASLELCRELYELSGWQETTSWWRCLDSNVKEVDWFVGYNGDIYHGSIPAYDLGYLLRKLPKVTKYGWLYLAPFDGELWWVYYQEGAAKPQPNYRAETPEDAAAKLAIELIKQGILPTKEQKGLGGKVDG